MNVNDSFRADLRKCGRSRAAVLAEFGIYFFTAKKVRPKSATRCDESAQFDTRLVCVKPDRTVMGVGSLSTHHHGKAFNYRL